jgi:hypothetical protein
MYLMQREKPEKSLTFAERSVSRKARQIPMLPTLTTRKQKQIALPRAPAHTHGAPARYFATCTTTACS